MQGGDGIRVRSGHGYLREFTRDLRMVSGEAKVSSGAAKGLLGQVGQVGRRHSELIGTTSEPGYCVRGFLWARAFAVLMDRATPRNVGKVFFQCNWHTLG